MKSGIGTLWKGQMIFLRTRNHLICSHRKTTLSSRKYLHTENNNSKSTIINEIYAMINRKQVTKASSLICEKVSELNPNQLSELMAFFSTTYYSIGHIDDMVSLLDRLDSAPINHQDFSMTKTYNTVIAGILDTRGPLDALEYWSKLCKSPKTPKSNQRTLEGLIAASLNCSPEWINEIKKYMKDNGMKVQSPYVSFQFIRHDLLCNNFDKAFAELQTWKPVPPEVLVKDFVCLVSRFTPDRLPIVFETYKDFWINKKSFVVNVFHKMRRNEDTAGHIALFKLIKQAGIKCSIEAFEALLQVAVMNKRDDMIKSVIYTAKVEQCRFSTTFYSMIIYYYAPTNRKLAWKYFREAAAENTAVEARVINTLCQTEQDPAVLAQYTPAIAEFVKRHELKLEDSQINFFANILLRHRFYDEAILWMGMLIYNTVQTKINRGIWFSLIQHLINDKQWNHVNGVIRSVPPNFRSLVEGPWKSLVKALIERKEFELVSQNLDAMNDIPAELARDIVHICTQQNNGMAEVYKTRFANAGIQMEE